MHVLAFTCIFAALLHLVSCKEYGPGIIQEIKQHIKDIPQSVDWRYCSPTPRKQIGPSCHTSAHGLQAMISFCLAEDKSPSKSNIYDLSLTDFWSCKDHYGFQHGINVVNWWNQNGAFDVDQDQKWNYEFARHCEQAWEKRKSFHQEGPTECRCRRDPETKNPEGALDPKKARIQPGFLDSMRMVHCRMNAQGNKNAWKNEINLAKLVAKVGPVSVMSSVESFGHGSVNNPSHRCVKKGAKGAGGHNYVVVGYNFGDSPHNAYWILSNSMLKSGGFFYTKMFNYCPEGYHPGTMGIGQVTATRYCIEGDKRGACGGTEGCATQAFEDSNNSLSSVLDEVESISTDEYLDMIANMWDDHDDEPQDHWLAGSTGEGLDWEVMIEDF